MPKPAVQEGEEFVPPAVKKKSLASFLKESIATSTILTQKEAIKNELLGYLHTSEADVEAVMDKLFDELAQKQNDTLLLEGGSRFYSHPDVLQVLYDGLRWHFLVWRKCLMSTGSTPGVPGIPSSSTPECGGSAELQGSTILQPLGASDYLEMSKYFDTVFIRNIPLMTLAKKTEARRFITLIDAFYEHKVRVVCLADSSLDNIFVQERQEDSSEAHRILMDDLGLSQGEVNFMFDVYLQDSASGLSIFTGEEEIFAFYRTISRLTEMQTEQYWNDGDRSNR
ncbi:AFG1L ATPase, partial [Polypterus senegalus]